jgi:hypothetical protein
MEHKEIARPIPQDLIDSLEYKEGDVYWKHKVSKVTKKGLGKIRHLESNLVPIFVVGLFMQCFMGMILH